MQATLQATAIASNGLPGGLRPTCHCQKRTRSTLLRMGKSS